MTTNITIAIVLLFSVCACNRAQTAEDIRIGRAAISVSEVSLLARNGFSKEALAEVKRRHISEKLTAGEEVILSGFANAELIAALKDTKNVLTRNQKAAYDEVKGKLDSQRNQALNNQMQQTDEATFAADQERRRRAHLSQQSQVSRNRSEYAGPTQTDQEAREQEQRRSVADRWESINAQNDRRGIIRPKVRRPKK